MTTIRLVTPFTAKSTAADVVAGIDLSSSRAIVTGGASGIGIEPARALAGAGAEVTVAVRNVEAGNRTAEDIAATTGNARAFGCLCTGSRLCYGSGRRSQNRLRLWYTSTGEPLNTIKPCDTV